MPSENQLKGFLEDQLNGSSDDEGLGSFLESQLDSKATERVNYRPEIHFKSSEDMSELEDGSVELIITSPPYNADWDYGSHDDNLDYSTEYLPMLARVFTECYRVLRPGGRMCVNIPSLLRSGVAGGFPIAGHIETMLGDDEITLGIDLSERNETLTYSDGKDPYTSLEHLRKCDWRQRETIAWVKPFNHDGLAPNGSFPRPWGVLLNNMHEVVLIFQKPGDRTYEDMSEETIQQSKITKTSDDYCDDVWRIQPDSWSPKYVDEEDIPVFPDELVERCIKLWSYKEDTVLDPFAGRFTVGKVAKQLERHSVGYEIREDLEKDIQEYAGLQQTGLGVF